MNGTTSYMLLKDNVGNGGDGTGAVSSVNGKVGPVTLTAADVNAVPTLRKVNNKALSADISLNASDIGLGNVTNEAQIPLSQKGSVNGVAPLDASGKIPASIVPISPANIVLVANEAARLALPQSTNLMFALQADTQIKWGINANLNPATSSNWINNGSFASSVISVNGATGAITIDLASLNGVSKTTTVNGKALSNNITLGLGDIITLNGDSNSYVGGDGALHQLPTNLATTDFLYATVTSAVSTTGQVPLTFKKGNMTLSSNNIILKKGVTYDLYASLAIRCTYSCYEWYDATTNTLLANASRGNSAAANSSDSMAITPAFLTITPDADIQVKLMVTAMNGFGAMNIDSCFVKVQQVGITGTTNVPDGILSSNVVLKDGSQVLTNKSLQDSTTKIMDNLDNTKAVQFECGGIATGTTRTLTIPDKNGTIALTSDLGTPTNLSAIAVYSNGTVTSYSANGIMKFTGVSNTQGGGITFNPSTGAFYVANTGNYKLSTSFEQYTASTATVYQWYTCSSSGVLASPINSSTGVASNNTSYGSSALTTSATINAGTYICVGNSSAVAGSYQFATASIEQLPISTVIQPNSIPVTDNSSSGYFDIGAMRIQWGVYGGGVYNPVITLPAPFKDANYSVPATVSSGSESNTFYIQINSKTTTSFKMIKRFQSGNSSGESADWFAIGLKP